MLTESIVDDFNAAEQFFRAHAAQIAASGLGDASCPSDNCAAVPAENKVVSSANIALGLPESAVTTPELDTLIQLPNIERKAVELIIAAREYVSAGGNQDSKVYHVLTAEQLIALAAFLPELDSANFAQILATQQQVVRVKLAELTKVSLRRDELVLQARNAGMTADLIAEAMGLSIHRVFKILQRANAAVQAVTDTEYIEKNAANLGRSPN